MNPSCSLPPLVDIYRAGRRGISWGPSVHGEGWEYFSWPLLGGGGVPSGSHSPGPVAGLDLVRYLARSPGPFGGSSSGPSGPISWSFTGPTFFVLFGPFEDSIFLVLRGSTFVVPRGLIFLVLSGARFLGPTGARLSWPIQGLDFFFHPPRVDFLVHRGFDSLLVL